MKTKKWCKVVSLICLSVFVMVSVVGCGGGDQKPAAPAPTAEKKVIKLRIGAGHLPDTTTWIGVLDSFFVPEVEKRVAERTNYKIEWNKTWGGTVAKLGEELEAIESGLLDLGFIVYVFEPTKLMMHGMTYRLPFTSPDPVLSAKAASEMYDKYPQVKTAFEKYNQKFLAVAVSEAYDLFTTFPLSKVSELKGKKIAGAGANLTWIEGTGAIPVQSNMNEAYTSMQTGLYQGFINPTSSMYRFKIHEVSKYLLQVGFGCMIVGGVTVNMNVWNKLPKEVQDIMLEVAKEYTAKQAQVTLEQYNKDVAAMQKDGVTITVLDPVEKEKWVNMLSNIPGGWAKEVDATGLPGTAFLKDYLKRMEELGYKAPRQWEL